VFDRKHQLAVMAAQVEKRIHPGIEIGGASQTVTGAAIGGDVLFGMMDKRNRRAGLALEQAEIAEQCSDFARRIFVDGMKPNQRVENEKNGPVKQERGLKPLLIGGAVQAQRIRGDDANVQTGQIEPVMAGQRFQARSKRRLGVFSSVEKHGTWCGYSVSGKACGAGSHRYGDFKRQPGLEAFRSSADDSDCLCAPEPIDQPRCV